MRYVQQYNSIKQILFNTLLLYIYAFISRFSFKIMKKLYFFKIEQFHYFFNTNVSLFSVKLSFPIKISKSPSSLANFISFLTKRNISSVITNSTFCDSCGFKKIFPFMKQNTANNLF